ncbi:MAG: KpsF/GutQ family sugar-phosphate isomerase [Burkholderiales bacterium]|jgi:arabinose-5-phosphate isomerase|nr:KpsF/GutQ family sugar-phosphate isomerase [Burkholderiales bacterium]
MDKVNLQHTVTPKIFAIANKVFADEIDGINTVAKNLNDDFTKTVSLILKSKGKVILIGIGKSGHIGRKIAATLASTGTPAFFVHPAEALHGDLGMIESHDVVIAISYSGESDEILAIIPAIVHKTVPIIAMTGNVKSSLAKFATHVLNIKIDKEACPLNLAPTTSTTVSLVLGDAIAVSLLELRGFKPEDFALSHPGGSLGRRLLTKVSDIMHCGDRLPIVFTNSSLKDAVVEISKKGLGLVAVLDSERKLCGVITDGDLRRILDHDADIRLVKAADIMNKTPKLLKSTNLATAAVYLMEKHKITGFLVVDEEQKLIGAFNLHDLFKAKLI